ncbi:MULTISPECIES: hypothetical protein [Clostridium]|uniref:hypothetical protein n=1 Tax=Clostridium TaxID=1485 RepID=UPI000825C260|nr:MULTISPECIES: hypothetical protein [Clostridium]PJI07660.1 hypothetical protein CUB90_07190 [Clostridium sp. CT7]
MNLGDLELNKKYKNYKIICGALEEPIKTGKSKQLQLKEWTRYFNYIKEGNGFLITEIYNVPKEKIDNRGKSEGSHANNSKFAKYIDSLLEQFLYNQKKNDINTLHITNNCLAQMIKMINFNYRCCEENREKFHKYMGDEYTNTPKIAERDVFYHVGNKIRPAILGSLNRLQKANKIKFELTYLIYKDNQVSKMKENDIDYVKEVEESLLKEVDTTKQKMMCKHDTKVKFYKKLNDIVMEHFELLNNKIDGFFQGYEIIIKKVSRQKDVKKNEKELNKLFIEDIIKSIEKSKEKIRNKYRDVTWGIPNYNSKWETEKMSLKYSIAYKQVINIVLSYTAINVIQKIKQYKTNEEIAREFMNLQN